MSDDVAMVKIGCACARCRSLGGGVTLMGVEIGRSVVILGLLDCQLFCCILM